MDTLTIILLTTGALALVALAWMSGYDIGKTAGTSAERSLANRRVNGVLASVGDVVAHENARRPKAAKNRRKAARKAVRA